MPRLAAETPRLANEPTRPADELLRVHGPEASREALRAAEEISVLDGRATAWLVVKRVLDLAWFAALLMAGTRDGWDGPWLWWTFAGVFVVLAVTDAPLARRTGAQPPAWTVRWRIAVTTMALVSYLGLVALTEPADPEALDPVLVGAAAVVGAAYLLAPVVRWARGRRRPRDVTSSWPAGAEALAGAGRAGPSPVGPPRPPCDAHRSVAEAPR